jgi:hypothetical protein
MSIVSHLHLWGKNIQTPLSTEIYNPLCPSLFCLLMTAP